MPKLTVMPNVEDIEHFLSAGTGKDTNDERNKIRENIIATIMLIGDEYLNHPKYGAKWRQIREKFLDTIYPLCEKPYNNITIKQMGGMSYNYDFLVTYSNDTAIVKEVKLEFKHNNTNVADLVQFLELYDKDCKGKYNICDLSYAEYYYNTYLNQYLSCDSELNSTIKPDLDVYLKNVYDIKYKHSFFKLLHSKKTNNIKEKKHVANESVKTYIQQFSTSFRFDKITEKIKESQTEKVFLLWDCENFHTQKLDVENFEIKNIKKLSDLYFDVAVNNFQYDIRVRINWGNSNGLANPRWKFSFIPKDK
jgi:hypothetical protein